MGSIRCPSRGCCSPYFPPDHTSPRRSRARYSHRSKFTLPLWQSPFSRLIVGLLKFFAKTYDSVFGMPDPPLHDPCAVAYVINPALFITRVCHVDIETGAMSSLPVRLRLGVCVPRCVREAACCVLTCAAP